MSVVMQVEGGMAPDTEADKASQVTLQGRACNSK